MDNNEGMSLERRNLLLAGGAALGVAAAGPVFGGSHEHQHHHGHGGGYDALVAAAFDCMATSQACLAHCLEEFKKGDTEMADCAQAVQESAVMCGAMAQMASLGSEHLKKIADACLDVCKSCEKACDEFADKHEVCKVCRNSCRDLIKQLKMV